MGEMSTSRSSEIEKIKQILIDEFKIQQRMIRSMAVEYQTLLKKTAVRLTNGLDAIYKEKLLYLDEIASKIASGDDVEEIVSEEFSSNIITTFDLNIAQIKNAIESWTLSSSKGSTDSYMPLSTPSVANGSEVRVDVVGGITKQGIFWLHLQELPESNQLALADLNKRISVEMLRDKEWKSFKESASSPNVGDYVLVDMWNGWARGKIEKLKDNNAYAVRLVDYGDLVSCGADLLRPMKSDLYPDADYQAIRCCLSLDEDPLNIPIEAVWAFSDLLRENLVAKNPVACIFKNKILDKDSEELWQVDLLVKSKKESSISVSQALNKKIDDIARGRDSIACRDIRYSATECAGSRYVERPAEGNTDQKSTVDVTEQPTATATPEEQRDTTSTRNGLHELMQLAIEKQQSVLSETSSPKGDGFIHVAGNDLVDVSSHQVSYVCQPEDETEQHSLLNEQSLLPSSSMPSSFPGDPKKLLHSELSYSPLTVSSDTLVALDKHSTLKADAAPFISRSQTYLDPLTKPAFSSTDQPVPSQPEDFIVPQELSAMELQYFGPAMSLQLHCHNYVRAKHLDFGSNMPPAMPGMVYSNQGPTYSYVPSTFNANFPEEEVPQNTYRHHEAFDSSLQVSERQFEEAKKLDLLLPSVCSSTGVDFTGTVTSLLEADGTFWMQRSRTDQQEVDAWSRLQATLSTCNKLTLPIASEEVVAGLMAIVPSSQTGELYRAEVLSVKDRKAVRCRLYGPGSERGFCSDQYARKLFDNLVKGGIMMATVMSVEPGDPETLVVKLCDNVGTNIMNEMMRSLYSQRLLSCDDSRLSVIQQSPSTCSASASLNDMANMSSEQSSDWCEPVKKLMASCRSIPASLADMAQTSLPLGGIPYDPHIPPPSLLRHAMFSLTGDASTRMIHGQSFTPSPDARNEWNNQETEMGNQISAAMETSTEAPRDRNGQLRQGSWQPYFRDDEQRLTPPLNVQSGGKDFRQQMTDDDKAKLPKHSFSTGCFNCGENGHIMKFCPLPRKIQGKSRFGRTNSRK